MLRAYIKLVRAGRRTLESVPTQFRDDVEDALKEED